MKDIERMVVSAHMDSEVESPWKEAVDQRIADEPLWAAEAALHRKVKEALASSPEPDFGPAQARVLARISSQAPRSPMPVRTLPLAWMSVAAAALFLVAAGTGFWLGRQSSAAVAPSAVAELQVEVPKQLELTLKGEGQLLMASNLRTAP